MVECVLTLPSAHLFLQGVNVESVLQGVPLPTIGAVRAGDPNLWCLFLQVQVVQCL